MKTFLPLLFVSAPALAATSINVSGLLSFLVYVVVVGLIFWCIWWALGRFAVPEPFNTIIRVVAGLVVLVFVINLLLGLVGSPIFTLR